MSPRPVRILCVEDDPIQQRLMGHALRGVKEFACDVSFESTEEGGVAAFLRASYDLVLADYHLAQGNGLNVVRRIREADPVVPIIAVSATASDVVAADLMISGADDYLDKTNLDTKTLGHSLRIGLLRADGLRKRLPGQPPARSVADELTDLSRWLAGAGAARLADLLKRCEASARAGGVSPLGLLRLFQTVAKELGSTSGADPDIANAALRPFLLDLTSRLFGDVKIPPA